MPCVSSAGVFVVNTFRVVARSAWYSGRRLTKQPHKLIMVQCSASPAKPQQSLSVAVIGAGAAGLVAARELVLEGHHVTVFEKGSSTGGVWVYTDEVETPDLLGQDPERHKVHSSMYAQLRTNLPREVMAYTDFAFDDLAGQSKDSRRFPSHEEVLRYLQAFAAAFQLHKFVRFDTEVTAAVPIFSHSHQHQPHQQSDGPQAAAHSNGNADVASNGHSNHQSPLPWPKWQITTHRVHHERQRDSTQQLPKLEQANSRQASASKPPDDPTQQNSNVFRSNGTQSHAQTDDHQSPEGASQPDSNTQTDRQSQTATYDALVVCNGHYSAPRCPEVKGSDVFPGQVMHSHNYRHNEAFKGQIVVLVGASASGEDICREIAEVAEKVYLCARSWQNPAWATETVPFGHQHNIWRRPVPASLAKDGSVTFSDGQRVEKVDSVMYCTGYLYTFPFLENIVSTADNRVAPVYRHIFPLSTAPTLSIIGLPWKVVPFPEFEVQAKWIAKVLSKRVHLPSMDAMQAEVQQFYADLERQEVPARYTHQLGDKQWEYKDWIAEQCGPDVPKTEPWRRKMYEATGQNKREFPDRYRDVWRDDDLVSQAKQAASKHSKELRAG